MMMAYNFDSEFINFLWLMEKIIKKKRHIYSLLTMEDTLSLIQTCNEQKKIKR